MIRVQNSTVLDILVKKLSHISREDDSEIEHPFRRLFGSSSWDFSGYREYSLMDDARRIDWKASIRSNKILVK